MRKESSKRRQNDIEKTIKATRKYLSINDIQQEYLPSSKKKIRSLVKKYLPYKMIGGRLFTDRTALEALLSDPDRDNLPLD